ncbi:phage major capsid protein [Oscillibacter sp. MSJ-2]|uniref:Phage major capsid protein n=1 Tax=Dysosmobacter acutus TaxID=2841504 RepID=A0ABS6FDS1_9FIRM|nr:phage major capsid protein [Dysosmobacter acutus]MBU5627712.1 phage major capsid protein [Dysosmobacter acutus]
MNKKMREFLAAIEEKQKEARSFADANETDKAAGILDEIDDLKKQYETEEKLFKLEQEQAANSHEEVRTEKELTQSEKDVKAFAGYVRAMVNKASTPQNITMGNNGAIIPQTIASQIIQKVKELCPIYANSTIYHSKGTLKIPVYGDKTVSGDDAPHNITVGFAAEFSELTADAGAFSSVDLTGYLVGALTLIGKSVVNNADIDVTNFIVNEMGKKIAEFLEDKLLNGASGYNQGALATTTTMNAGSTSAITADNLIDLQAKIPTAYQGAAAWYMAPATFTAIRKLKDGNNRYLLQDDITGTFPYRLLGKPVYISDNMPAIASAAKAVLYGDASGLAVNIREEQNIQVLTEKYATQHAIGVVAWMEFDSKVADNQKLATLVMSANS